MYSLLDPFSSSNTSCRACGLAVDMEIKSQILVLK
jgi:hypothetical protein